MNIEIESTINIHKPFNVARYHTFAIVMMASIASLGTMPYAFQFAQLFASYSQSLYFVAGSIFALTAAFANTALGTYSLLAIHKLPGVNASLITIISFASSIPTGCMCYFAYQAILPLYLNLITTAAVTLINAGIGYTAIMNLIISVRQNRSQIILRSESVASITGFVIGILSSLAACMAAIHGLTGLFLAASLDRNLATNLALLIGWGVWIPVAALYANSTQILAVKLIYFFTNIFVKMKKINVWFIISFVIAACSGTSYAKITIDFFNPAMNIPAFFKYSIVQGIIDYILIPLSYLSNVGVNYWALCNLSRILKTNCYE